MQLNRPTTMGELRRFLAELMVLSTERKLPEQETRLALIAALRITENFQAEIRARKVSHEMGQRLSAIGDCPLGPETDKGAP